MPKIKLRSKEHSARRNSKTQPEFRSFHLSFQNFLLLQFYHLNGNINRYSNQSNVHELSRNFTSIIIQTKIEQRRFKIEWIMTMTITTAIGNSEVIKCTQNVLRSGCRFRISTSSNSYMFSGTIIQLEQQQQSMLYTQNTQIDWEQIPPNRNTIHHTATPQYLKKNLQEL